MSGVTESFANGVLTLSLDRPDKRNAIDAAMLDGLAAGLARAELDADVRAVVLRGAGRDFCAGADLDELLASADKSLEENERSALALGEIFLALRQVPKPTVAVVHGRALAGGAGLAILFGLSGTGKTTLSADPKRYLIGDDEHGWSDNGVFNIEGGCYAKAVYLTMESEPEIFEALKFGTVLENVVYDKSHHHVDFNDTSITQNTRGAYPIEFMRNAKIPCVASHPSDIIFLTCDAFGIFPPVARLTPEQAMYYFISGYTAKVAGTEVGVTEPEATFSPCFGGPFLVWHPGVYAKLLAEKIRRHEANVWLVNTGWSGGSCGTGSRMPLRFTRAIVDGIHSGQLASAPVVREPIMGLDIVTECEGVPAEMMQPSLSWRNTAAFEEASRKLAARFRSNFEKYANAVDASVVSSGPTAS